MTDDPSSSSQDKSWLDKLTQAFSAEPKSREELLDLLRAAGGNGLLDSDALGIVEGALAVADLQVREIMVPRSQMVVVKADATPQDFLPMIIESAHSRFPVVGESLDDIQGILLAKDLLGLILEGTEQFDLKKRLRPANIVPESKRLNVLLREFREQRYHMAVVIDEYGGVSGLVTIEDILEEIVGEIEDETDIDEEEFIRQIAGRDYLVKALTPIEDFNERFQTQLSDEEFDTIGGLLMKAFGHLPQRNETTDIEGFRFKVLNADNRQVHLLRMTAPESAFSQ